MRVAWAIENRFSVSRTIALKEVSNDSAEQITYPISRT